MKRAVIAQDTATSVADSLFQTEAAIDHALSQIAGFAQSLPAAGKDAGFSATRGQGVYERLAEAMVAQSQVRARIVEVHNLLAELKENSIMRSMMIGGGTKDSDPTGTPTPTGRLALAAVA